MGQLHGTCQFYEILLQQNFKKLQSALRYNRRKKHKNPNGYFDKHGLRQYPKPITPVDSGNYWSAFLLRRAHFLKLKKIRHRYKLNSILYASRNYCQFLFFLLPVIIYKSNVFRVFYIGFFKRKNISLPVGLSKKQHIVLHADLAKRQNIFLRVNLSKRQNLLERFTRTECHLIYENKIQ